MSGLNLQKGDIVQVVESGLFAFQLQADDTLEVVAVGRSYQSDYTLYKFRVLSCSDPRLLGRIQYGNSSWVRDYVRKLPKLKEVPHDTTTPLKVGDYVEVIYQYSDEVGLIKKIVGFNDAGYIRTLSQAGPFAGQEICYTKREYLSLIK